MTHRTTLAVLSIAACLALFGFGCSGTGVPAQEPSGPTVSTFENVTPAQATARINLVPGSIIELRSTFLGFGAKIAAALAGDKKEGTRIITIDRFAPGEVAGLTWSLSTKVEADSSIKARADAKKANKPEPEPVMVDQTESGKLLGINLKSASSLMLPAYWPQTDDASTFGTSAIWLSKDAFDGLSRNRVATLSLGVLDASLQGDVKKAKEFADALSKLQGQVTKIENRTDVVKLEGDKDLIEWPLKVNGKDIKVEVIKAHTWFGEIVVLNSQQNPLVLKATLNPAAEGLSNVFNLGALQALLGYEVTSISDVQM
ncbi:MAG: hypothetical protein ABIO72_04410 [Patescibacteria group bacterium]